MNTVNPTVVMTEMGKLGWSEPAKANEMLSKIPMGKFAGNYGSGSGLKVIGGIGRKHSMFSEIGLDNQLLSLYIK